ncbi:hypothetical protein PFISCL1PPCAC_26223, partial [Pristionchus fissidentatus]
FIFGGFLDLATYFVIAVISTPTAIPFITEWVGQIQRTETSTAWEAYSPYISISISLTYFFPLSQDCLNLVIAVNRLTAIATPIIHRKATISL